MTTARAARGLRAIGRAVRRLAASRADRRLFAEALVTLVAVRVALSTRSFQSVYAWAVRARGGRTRAGGAATGPRIAWALQGAGRLVPACTCLTRALAAELMLGRRGETGRLRIGVARDDRGRVHAHAWLEHRGSVLIGGGSNLQGFTPLTVL